MVVAGGREVGGGLFGGWGGAWLGGGGRGRLCDWWCGLGVVPAPGGGGRGGWGGRVVVAVVGEWWQWREVGAGVAGVGGRGRRGWGRGDWGGGVYRRLARIHVEVEWALRD